MSGSKPFTAADTPGPPTALRVVSAPELAKMSFAPQRFVIDGFLPTGLTILAGRPKIGKSWLALNLSLAVASGGLVLGRKATGGAALYLALEDNDRRLKERMATCLGANRPPEALAFATSCPPLDGADRGAVAAIREWCASVKDAKLVVIDVLQRIRPAAGNGSRLYAEDYSVTLPLKALADELDIAVVVVCHTRKTAEETADPLEMVSGTLGLVGAADHVIVLDRNGAGTSIYGRGRDVAELDLAVAFDPRTATWRALGDREAVTRSDIRNAILDAMKRAGRPMGPSEIAAEADRTPHLVRQRLRALLTDGDVIQLARGQYALPSATGETYCPPATTTTFTTNGQPASSTHYPPSTIATFDTSRERKERRRDAEGVAVVGKVAGVEREPVTTTTPPTGKRAPKLNGTKASGDAGVAAGLKPAGRPPNGAVPT